MHGIALVIFAVVLFVTLLGMTVNDVGRVIKTALKDTRATASQTAKIAGLSFGGIMLTLFGIPLVIFYLGVMYYSLR